MAGMRMIMSIYGDALTPDMRDAGDRVALSAPNADEAAGAASNPIETRVDPVGFETSDDLHFQKFAVKSRVRQKGVKTGRKTLSFPQRMGRNRNQRRERMG
jgi:hypothetical protein